MLVDIILACVLRGDVKPLPKIEKEPVSSRIELTEDELAFHKLSRDFLQQGRNYLKENKLEEAIECVEEALEYAPRTKYCLGQAHNNLGAFHNHYAKMLRFVIEDTEKEITKHKRNRKRRSVKKGRKEIRAMKQYLGFQVYMAGKEYDKAIELWDDNEVFYENKAKWCKFREDTSWVLEFSKKALDLKPNDPHYVFLYGVACYESRKYQDALIYVAKSCKLDEGYHDRAAILMKKIHHDMKMDAKKFSVLNN